MTRPPFKRALGIATGDIVRTSYNTGPYEVWRIYGPEQWCDSVIHISIWPQPIISLGLILPGTGSESNPHTYGINEIRREGDRWFTANAEVFVETAQTAIQGSLFDPIEERTADPYQFQPDVDYQDPRTWRCRGCNRDFNDKHLAEPPTPVTTYSSLVYGQYKRVRPDCPYCGDWPVPIHWVGPNTNAFLEGLAR